MTAAHAAQSKLGAALDLARHGFNVFPLVANTKVPAVSGWQYWATTDETRIREEWTNRPDSNIGVHTDRLLVIDIDPRNGGDDTFAMLNLLEDFPDTMTVKTAGGGTHLYYTLPPDVKVKSRTHALGQGVDVKSSGGYAVGPCSVVDGRPYTCADMCPPAPAPTWPIGQCQRARPKSAADVTKPLVEEDEISLARAIKYLNNAPEATEGNRNDTAFKLAARFYDPGVTLETCRELLGVWNTTKCFPPLGSDELDVLADSALHNRDRPPGWDHPLAPGFEAVDIPYLDPQSPLAKRIRARVTVEAALALVTPPDVAPNAPPPRRLPLETFDECCDKALTDGCVPLIDGAIDCGTTVIVYGERNAGKSFLAMAWAHAVATGRPIAGMATTQGAAMYVVCEGQRGARKRFRALRQEYPHSEHVPLVIVPTQINLRNSNADVSGIIEAAQDTEARTGHPVRLIVLDTLARILGGGDENNGMDTGALLANTANIQEATGATILFVHHPGHHDKNRPRGHSNLPAAADTEIEVKAAQPQFGHPPFGTIKFTKQRDAEHGLKLTFSMAAVNIGVDSRGRPQRTMVAVVNPANSSPK